MRSGIVAVWDKDREYAARLTEYLYRQKGMASSVVLYSEPDALKKAVETHQVSLALVGRPVSESPWLQDTPVMTLSEERDSTESTVYKYQPAREVLRIVSDARDREAAAETACGSAAYIRGIYSPSGGCLKTSLGLVMGRILAEKKSCLFLSLEAHSGFRTLFDRQYPVDLSDLFAAVRQGEGLKRQLSAALQSFGQLQYIPPVIWPEDIREAEKGELKELVRRLAWSGFDELIIDVGSDLARPEEVLSWCDQIYHPQKEDAFSLAKLWEYESYLKISGYESLALRTKRIPLSELGGEISPYRLDQWQRWEQMIPAVRKLLAEEAADEE